ncbi:PQQ-binding-like beta-propeller repeat protein, partial [Bacteroidota bacterium]
FTFCLNRENGLTLWKKEAPRPRKEKLDNRNNPASPSPVVDKNQVYVFFPDYGILAYDFKGNEKWKVPLGPFNNDYGMGGSPIVTDNKIILICDQNIDSYIIALNKSNGEIIWKKARPEAKSGHSTPIIYIPENGEKQIIAPGSFLLTSYSANTGDKIWWCGGLSFEMKSTPVIHNGYAYINGYATPMNQPENNVKIPTFTEALSKFDADKNGKLYQKELPKEPVYGWFAFVDVAKDGFLDSADWSYFEAALASLNGMLAIRLGGQGDMTKQSILWQYHKSVPQLPSPLIYKDVLYMLNDGGIVTTFDPKNGDVIQKGRIKGAGTSFYSSPVAADNKIYMISRKGKISVLKQGGSLEVLATSELNELCYATPAIADGKIYLRTVNTLYCFGY